MIAVLLFCFVDLLMWRFVLLLMVFYTNKHGYTANSTTGVKRIAGVAISLLIAGLRGRQDDWG